MHRIAPGQGGVNKLPQADRHSRRVMREGEADLRAWPLR